MVKKQFLCAVGAAVVLGVCNVASAGGQLRINNDSSNMPLVAAGTAVSYAYNADLSKYVADVTLQGFLFCNHSDTPTTPPIDLVARHGAWVFGSATGVAPVPGVADVFYDEQVLNLSADGSTQCFHADAHGLGIADLHHIFVSGFDAGEVAAHTSNTSSVRIVIDQVPVDTDHTFVYTIFVSVADSNASLAMGDAGTQSLTTTSYYLNEGYDTSVFSNCNIVPGQAVSGNMTITRACNLQAGVSISQLDGMTPVVAAALFTGPDANETYFGDNLAFGYPVVTPQ